MLLYLARLNKKLVGILLVQSSKAHLPTHTNTHPHLYTHACKMAIYYFFIVDTPNIYVQLRPRI